MQDRSQEPSEAKLQAQADIEAVTVPAHATVLKADDPVPEHVVIIMDGNHRWASARHLPGAAGHRAGAKRLRPIAEACAELGVKSLTVFAFSTENWHRPDAEVGLLMDLMRHVMRTEIDYLHQQGVRLRVIGERSHFAPDIQKMMAECEALTADNTRLSLSVAVNFGGRWDIVNAARQMAQKVADGELQPAQVDEEAFASALSLSGLPEPDLLIRTGGDYRISNFLLWDLAYTELFFTDLFWPDFDAAALQEAVATYALRTRRFGGRK
ncbi:MAG TPA: di-trans,poly-cis-decaprenylcistransferase [Gammaproteobacteria bacterium]|jgi:undecaprenyl diphosphate synthase|nr:di-trans,poly-cis-decaprenylcistransferase [Gammaproteobacteria bacterium]